MTRASAVLALAVALAFAGCPQAPVSPPPDADAAAPLTGCDAACTQLRVLGCPETAACEATCRHVLETHLVELRLGCMVGAQTRAEARDCGSACP